MFNFTYPVPSANSILLVCSKGFWICRNGNTAVTGPVCRGSLFCGPLRSCQWLRIETHRSAEAQAGPSPAGHFSLDLNDPNLNSWCTCLISACVRLNLYLMIFWLWALVNCQAEPVLKQARSGREGPDLSLVPESSIRIYTCNAYLQVAFKMSSYLD